MQPGIGFTQTEKLKRVGLKLRWDLDKEAARLRTTIATHVAFLNLRLITLGL